MYKYSIARRILGLTFSPLSLDAEYQGTFDSGDDGLRLMMLLYLATRCPVVHCLYPYLIVHQHVQSQ